MVFMIRNYTGRDQRFVTFKDGELKVVRCYVSQGQAFVAPTTLVTNPMDGVMSGILQDVIYGLPQPNEDDAGMYRNAYIVRKDVAMAALQLSDGGDGLYLVPYDPVMVPMQLRFETKIEERDCKVASGRLNDPEGMTLQEQGYVCYGYRRLMAMKSENVAVNLPLIFPVLVDGWPTDEQRQEDFRQAVIGLKERIEALPQTKVPETVKTAIQLAEANSVLFKMTDAELSQLLLRLSEAEWRVQMETTWHEHATIV